jgi:MFS superfamily sulfate permease-like transporter
VKGRNLARELLASVVVFLVALPLCMGIAIASGVPPAMGLLSGIVGGLVVGSLAGSPLQVSGPAAGLAVIVYEIVQAHGLAVLAVVVTLAGLLQIAAGALKVGQWFRAVAPAVIYAMLAGIGVLIFASQFHVMVDDAPQASGLTNLLTIPQAVIKGMTPEEGKVHHFAAGIGLLTLGVLIGWNLLKKKLPSALATIPAPLLAVGAAVAAAYVLQLPIAYVQVPATLSELINVPALGDFSSLLKPAVLGSVFALAAVASAESLLCASAVDKLHDGERSDLDRELMAQGVGNTLLGLLGGLPLTGVIVRSSANVEAGGKTRWSAILHGAWLLIFVAALPFVLELIPVASLAGVLVYIGYKLVKVDAIKELWRRDRTEVLVYGVTVGAIVATNLLDGLMIGLGLSVLHLAWKASRLEVEVVERSEGVLEVDLRGSATFVVLPRLARELERLDPAAEVHLHLEHLSYVDHACFELIRDWERQREPSGGSLVLEWDELERRGRGLQIPRKAA